MYRYIASDVIRRTLEQFGYEVRQVMNTTDVGHLVNDADAGQDKMALAAHRDRTDPAAIAAAYTQAFFRDSAKLNIQLPHVVCPATEHIKLMIDMVSELVVKGYAYAAADGVYFSVDRWPPFGDLSRTRLDQLRVGARVEANPNKRDPLDFALWRSAKPGDLQAWDSPWGSGNPGWHIECSAMSLHYLGEDFDLHTGGEDNLFPHHECELAQAEAAGHRFARHWVHVRFLRVDGGKMSKSRGTLFTLADLQARGIEPLAFRLFCLQGSYVASANFTFDGVLSQHYRLARWRARFADAARRSPPAAAARRELIDPFLAALADDLNTARALAHVEALFDRLSSTDPNEVSQALAAIRECDRVLALGFGQEAATTMLVTPEEQELLQERAAARARGDFLRSDALRDELDARGLEVRDTSEGQTWRRR